MSAFIRLQSSAWRTRQEDCLADLSFLKEQQDGAV